MEKRRLWSVSKSSNSAAESLTHLSSRDKAALLPEPAVVADCDGISSFPEWNFDDSEPAERHHDLRNWLTTVGLSRFEDYTIDPSIETIRMGLGWDRGVDVDASVALFDEHLRAVDSVWYRKLQSSCGCVVHSGDNLTGVGDGDDEVISVKLSEIPHHIHHLLFTVCIFTFDVSFRQVRSAYVRMCHGKEKYRNVEMCRFALSDMSGSAMLMGLLTRKGPYWNFKALGTPATGRSIAELLQNPRNLGCLSDSPSYSPELRRVTIAVIRGAELAAKDRSGFFRGIASSDPYYVIRFKNKEFTSEYRAQTLNPEWKSSGFDLGFISEVETKPLKLELFDYDAIGADDFMGMIRVPGYALFNLGVGEHIYWFRLGNSKKKESVSGRVLLSIRVEAMNFQPKII